MVVGLYLYNEATACSLFLTHQGQGERVQRQDRAVQPNLLRPAAMMPKRGELTAQNPRFLPQ